MGLGLLLLSVVLLFVGLFRTRATMGFIGLGMLADVLAFLNLFIPNGSVIVAVVCAIIFILLFILLVREWKKVPIR
jgi:tellurite resistance protein TehA-like permease